MEIFLMGVTLLTLILLTSFVAMETVQYST